MLLRISIHQDPQPIEQWNPLTIASPQILILHEPGLYYNTPLFDKLYSLLDHIQISWALPKQSTLQLKNLKDI